MLAVAEHNNIHSELIPRLATGFCGGLAHTGGNCGAVSGGILALGFYYGRSSPSQRNDACYEAVRAFMGKFSTKFGALSCPALTGVDLGTLEGQTAFNEKGQWEQCTNYVGEAVRMVVELQSKYTEGENHASC